MMIQVYCAHGIFPCSHIFISTGIQFLKLHINVHHESVQVRRRVRAKSSRARAPGTGAAFSIELEWNRAMPDLLNLTR